MDSELIAPCGMNCNLCSGYLAYHNDTKNKGFRTSYCIGCRPRKKNCAFLKKTCELLQNGKVQYCYECNEFPCKRLQHLDENYRNRYRMSPIENLQYIKENGMEQFLAKEEEKWECSNCGDTICCHNGICYNCGLEILKKKEKQYRWEDD